MTQIEFMSEAFKQAKLAYKNDEVPVGCVIVKDGKIISRAFNQKQKKNDPTSHAEIECIRKACKKLNKKYLDDSEMYVTLEPCLMCVGAIRESRLKKIYVGAKDPKGGYVVSKEIVLSKKELDRYSFGYLEQDISKLLKSFFKSKRKLPRQYK